MVIRTRLKVTIYLYCLSYVHVFFLQKHQLFKKRVCQQVDQYFTVCFKYLLEIQGWLPPYYIFWVWVCSLSYPEAKCMRSITLPSVACLALPYPSTLSHYIAVCGLSGSTISFHIISLHCLLWPVWLYHILPHYLITLPSVACLALTYPSTLSHTWHYFRKRVTEYKSVFWFSLQRFS
jgi:hypothetical protein